MTYHIATEGRRPYISTFLIIQQRFVSLEGTQLLKSYTHKTYQLMLTKYFSCLILLIIGITEYRLGAQTHFYFVEDAVSLGNNCYQITPNRSTQRGAVWALHKLDLTEDFTLDFSISFGSNDANGADGITFSLHNTCATIGSPGGGLGYLGITSSLAIEFDTWQNSDLFDPWYDHIAIVSKGNVSHIAPENLAGPIQASVSNPNIEDGIAHDVLIEWDATSQTFQIFFDGNLRLSYVGDIVTDIFGGNPRVNWGFTGSTGGSTNLQQFCINNYPTPVVLEDADICLGESVSVSLPSELNYSWSPTQGVSDPTSHNPTLNPSTSTLYTVNITDDCGRSTIDKIQINVNQPPIINEQNDIICPNSTKTLSLENTYPAYLWSDGSTASTLTVDTEGTYWVEVGNECGTTRAFFNVTLSIPEINLELEDEYCNYDSPLDLSNGIAQIDGNAVTSLNPATLGIGTHTLVYTYTDPNTGCSDTLNQDFDIVESFIPQTEEAEICSFSGDVLWLNAGEAGSESYFWYNEDNHSIPLSLSADCEIKQSGTYKVKLVNAGGCETTNTFVVQELCEPAIFIPEIFTPNGDAINDELSIFGRHFTSFQIKIFNRWGEIVFFSTYPQFTWDGNYNNKPVTEGVYVCEIQYQTLPDGELVKEIRYLRIAR